MALLKTEYWLRWTHGQSQRGRPSPEEGRRWTRGKFQSRVTEHKHCCSHPMSGHTRKAMSWRSQDAKSGPEPANEQVTRGRGQTRNSEAELSQRRRLEGCGEGTIPTLRVSSTLACVSVGGLYFSPCLQLN